MLYPPVETGRFAPAPVGEHYMVLAELMAHKRIDVAIRAFNRLGLPLLVVGNGPDARRLHRIAGPTIRFTGFLGDARVAELLVRARALVVPATEEFGIAAVEAHAAGRPVIALREGGARETVIDGVNGTFFDQPTVDALTHAIDAFDPMAIDRRECVRSAERFGVERFNRGMRAIVDEALADDRPPRELRRRRPRGLALAS